MAGRRKKAYGESADCIYDRYVNAIVSGHLKRGAKLPTMREIAEANGVTFRTARNVVERLGREGYVKSCPHVGTVVRPKNHTVWNGNVAFVLFEDDCASYFVASILDSLRRALIRAGYLFMPVVASRMPRGDCSQFKTLLGQRVDFIILMYPAKYLEALAVKSGVPYVVLFGQTPSRPNAWSLALDATEPCAAFVRHCAAANVRKVALVRFAGGDYPPVKAGLKAIGVHVSEIEITPLAGLGRYDGIERAALEFFRALPRAEFPDVFLLGDDFVAQGVLTAFLWRGVRVPDDVCVVAVANRGLGPVYPEPLTRFEWNGVAMGQRAAKFIIGILGRGRQPEPPTFSPEYIFGKTFPWRFKLHET